ncbi:DUF3383 family protein [Candidatus Symbiopectobacterium endolongispinus]|uniref:DUF3383 family protein n=1 Tax=Candidatus Symbiopectobacterium endolongispinus TaxID=2812664 RepID=UPI002079F44A|nr:DUF3383 family protein [Candidatus Symbiopectobacterium endolongispinus]
MAYPVDNIIPINLLLKPAGLGYADFSSAIVFADAADLVAGVTFAVDTFRDYSSVTDVAADFKTDSDIYRIATRYFANIQKPPTITVWMKNATDTLLEIINSANDRIWRYHYFLKNVDVAAAILPDLSDCRMPQAIRYGSPLAHITSLTRTLPLM